MITDREIFKRGHLTARITEPSSKEPTITGTHKLNLDGKRDGYIYVPTSYSSNKKAALAIMLHGAGGQAEHGLSLLQHYADANNIILVAPASRSVTWDIIANDTFHGDVIFINQVLEMILSKYNINASKVAIGGFSDGASYALCIGLSNGNLFTHTIAFSPGFAFTVATQGKPAVFISHGVNDAILPIDPCSRRLVPNLTKQGYPVHYEEFNGEHEIPADVSNKAVEWFMK